MIVLLFILGDGEMAILLTQLEQKIADYLESPPFPATLQELTYVCSPATADEIRQAADHLAEIGMLKIISTHKKHPSWAYNYSSKS